MSLVIFLALMLGLAVASVASLGVGQLILVPLVLATVAMIAAVTYQLQSWLGRIVGNKRRRGTVVAVAVVIFILLANAPNLIFNRAPRAMSTTSMMVPNSTATMFLASLLVLVVFTLFILPLALVLWIERSVSAAGWPAPVYLAFSVLELVLVAGFYRRRLTKQGHLLGERLELVLERVTEAVD